MRALENKTKTFFVYNFAYLVLSWLEKWSLNQNYSQKKNVRSIFLERLMERNTPRAVVKKYQNEIKNQNNNIQIALNIEH